jgi:hypothetical protein
LVASELMRTRWWRRPSTAGRCCRRSDFYHAAIGLALAEDVSDHLTIDYRLGSGEQLPLPDAWADIACCADVLE